MACISKISAAITYDCDGVSAGLESAILINKEDILSYTTLQTDGRIDLITLKAGASAYKLDTVKRTLVMSEALKTNEGAPNAFTHTANIVCTSAQAAAMLKNLVNPAANGSFVILTRCYPENGVAVATRPRVYGLYYGMSATAIDRSTHDNGAWYSITLATPERVLGEDALGITDANYASLYAASVG